MQIKEGSFTIVLAGAWNQLILTPQWIKEYLFDNAEEIKVEFSTNPIFVVRHRIKNIFMSVDTIRVILSSADNSDESLQLMENTAIKLCKILSHTPLQAVGMNFGFIQTEDKERLFELFKFKDDEKLIGNDWEIHQPIIKRRLKKESIFLNFETSIGDDNNIHFSFNYHYPTPSCTMIEKILSDKVIPCKSMSIEFLKSLYSLTIQ